LVQRSTKKLTNMKQILILTLIAISLSSCFQQFYKTNTTSKIDAVAFEQLLTWNKSFFVHTPDEIFTLENAKLDKGFLTGKKESLNPKYEKYMNPIANEANRYPKREKEIALSQVHVYTNSVFQGESQINLGMNQIFRMDVYNKDMAATKKSKVLSIVGIVAPIVIVVGIGAAAVAEAESKPFDINVNFSH
jgi:hypothetical protein